jgi:outer membrane murein-binding lipoprotein Lpp
MQAKKRSVVTLSAVLAVLLVAPGCESLQKSGLGETVLGVFNSGSGEMTLSTMVAGLKEALQVGTGKTVAATSSQGGYLNNPLIRIKMPAELDKMATALRKVGLGSQVDQFENKMNEAAELAAKEAAPVFIEAIQGMTFEDAKAILQGSDTAATDYFRGKTSASLKQRYRPIIQAQMQQLGVVKLSQDLEQKYNQIPFVPKTTVSVEDYVTDKALAGLFSTLAGEEKKIRQDPAARTTELLRQVFGKK